MPSSRFITIDGKTYLWRDILKRRQEQLAAHRQAEQLALFGHLPEDARPGLERKASDRYQQPSLLGYLADHPHQNRHERRQP